MSDDLDDILESIFDVIDLPDPRLKDKLRQGLARGLEVATQLGQDVKVELDLDLEHPEVVVLDGGREPTEEREPSAGDASMDASQEEPESSEPLERPPLSVHSREEVADGHEAFPIDDFDSLDDLEDLIEEVEVRGEVRPGTVRVNVLDSRRLGEPVGSEAPVGAGRIDVSDAMQTVFRGATAAVYRLYCADGELAVRLDGRGVETLAPGQSMDVEAQLVQVEGDGEGWYLRL